MILEVDAGNTRVKWRLRRGSETVASGIEHWEDEAICRSLQQYRSQVDVAHIACVASSSARQQLVSVIEATCDCGAVLAASESAFAGLQSSYVQPEAMGVDRWLAMIAAWVRFREGVAVVDAGSALTVDYIGRSGKHLGGYILPGWSLMKNALFAGTSRVARDHELEGICQPGRNTLACVENGRAWLWHALAQQIKADQVTHDLAHVVLAGGDAHHLLAMCPDLGVCWPDLVLDGLAARWPDAFSALATQ